MLRGNAGEVATLVGVEAEVRGVESIGAGGDAAELAREAARTLGLVASVTGAVDHVSDGERSAAVSNGHELLAAITGTGCMSTRDHGLLPRREGRSVRGGRRGAGGVRRRGRGRRASDAKGPGSFHVALYDALAALDPATLTRASAKVAAAMRLHALVADAETARAAAEGGATVVQLRLKDAPTAEWSSSGRALAGLGAELVVNDDVDAALELGCGVHLGQGDPGRARASRRASRSGSRRRTRREAAVAEFAGATYIGAGPIWATPSKPDAGEPIGLDGLRDVCLAVTIPVVAIGGIDSTNAADCIRAGASGVAVIRALPRSRRCARSSMRLSDAGELGLLRELERAA